MIHWYGRDAVRSNSASRVSANRSDFTLDEQDEYSEAKAEEAA